MPFWNIPSTFGGQFEKTDYASNDVGKSFSYFLQPWEYVITPDFFGYWKRHVAWAKSDGKEVKEYLNQRYATSMVFMSLLLNAELAVVFNPSQTCTHIRHHLSNGDYHTFEFYAGLAVIMSVFCTLFALLSIFIVWGMISSVSENNCLCVIRSSIGQYTTQLPSRFILSSLLLFLTWTTLFQFILLPVTVATIISLSCLSLYLHLVRIYSVFGRLLMHSGAMNERAIIDPSEESSLKPDDLHEKLGERAERHMKKGTSVTVMYKHGSSTAFETMVDTATLENVRQVLCQEGDDSEDEKEIRDANDAIAMVDGSSDEDSYERLARRATVNVLSVETPYQKEAASKQVQDILALKAFSSVRRLEKIDHQRSSQRRTQQSIITQGQAPFNDENGKKKQRKKAKVEFSDNLDHTPVERSREGRSSHTVERPSQKTTERGGNKRVEFSPCLQESARKQPQKAPSPKHRKVASDSPLAIASILSRVRSSKKDYAQVDFSGESVSQQGGPSLPDPFYNPVERVPSAISVGFSGEAPVESRDVNRKPEPQSVKCVGFACGTDEEKQLLIHDCEKGGYGNL